MIYCQHDFVWSWFPPKCRQPTHIIGHKFFIDLIDAVVDIPPDFDLGGKFDFLVQATLNKKRVVVDNLCDFEIHRFLTRETAAAAFLIDCLVFQHVVLEKVAGGYTQAAETTISRWYIDDVRAAIRSCRI